MRLFIIMNLLLSLALISCQKKQLSQDDLSIKFNNDWCSCMENESKDKTPEVIISQISVNCIQSVMLQYTQDEQLYDDIRALVAAKGYDDTLSDYEKEKLFGKELGKILITNAVDNCIAYRHALVQYKKDYIEKAKKEMDPEDKTGTDELINNMQSHLDGIDASQTNNPQIKKRVSAYYALLGLLYEYAGKEIPAIEQYDKAILIDPENSNAIAFKKLLVRYKNDEQDLSSHRIHND
ncbi:MAG: hypothetical protein LBU84_03210 [Prevotella sp.]|nr:hypothetical protein [Prevotella sp.]